MSIGAGLEVSKIYCRSSLSIISSLCLCLSLSLLLSLTLSLTLFLPATCRSDCKAFTYCSNTMLICSCHDDGGDGLTF